MPFRLVGIPVLPVHPAVLSWIDMYRFGDRQMYNI
jgi:hypothetical protein